MQMGELNDFSHVKYSVCQAFRNNKLNTSLVFGMSKAPAWLSPVGWSRGIWHSTEFRTGEKGEVSERPSRYLVIPEVNIVPQRGSSAQNSHSDRALLVRSIFYQIPY